jgi:hypothetical protein
LVVRTLLSLFGTLRREIYAKQISELPQHIYAYTQAQKAEHISLTDEKEERKL